MGSEHICDFTEVVAESGTYWEARCRACSWYTDVWFWATAVRGALDHYDYDLRQQAHHAA